jgi:hypothetical protein
VLQRLARMGSDPEHAVAHQYAPAARREPFRALLGWALLGLCAAAAAPAAAAPAPRELSVRLECQRRPTPGRVLCEAELELSSGVLRWTDVLVVTAPDFARPLRSRVGPSALFMKTERRQRLQLALAATQLGRGTLKVQARAVSCPDATGQDCRALVREVETSVAVGPITE